MKAMFCIDVSTNKENTVMDGEELISATISPETQKAYQNSLDSLKEVADRAELPTALSVIRAICGSISLILIYVILGGSIKVGPVKAFENAPYCFVALLVAVMIFLLLTMMRSAREKAVTEDASSKRVLQQVETQTAHAYRELGVPDGAEDIDVLSFCYYMKSGGQRTEKVEMTEFLNNCMKIFSTETHLCLADVENVYSVPLEEITGIRTVKKWISFKQWNKEIGYGEGKYKSYNIENNRGNLLIRSVRVLDFVHDGEQYSIWFPCYEEDILEKITGLPIQKS